MEVRGRENVNKLTHTNLYGTPRLSGVTRKKLRAKHLKRNCGLFPFTEDGLPGYYNNLIEEEKSSYS